MSKKDVNFEELIEKLEEITNKLEKEQLSLDESVKLFEEGMQISKECNSKLEDAEKRITILINQNDEINELTEEIVNEKANVGSLTQQNNDLRNEINQLEEEIRVLEEQLNN